ncbi:MAG TPA: HAD family phosphatase [Burkholderiales bacterium]|nr:HAD family phosphatase [Burkholderiales bacterium]
MNLIFDLGGVVVRWDPDAIISRASLDSKLKADLFSHPDWLEIDRGTATPEEFVRRLASRTGIGEADLTRLVQSVPASLVPFPETVDLLYRLKARGYPLYCLSNMGHASIDYLERRHRFFEVFAGKVISCRVNLCKPDAAIFEHALRSYGLKPRETVFIDDVEKNVSAAAQLGIRTIHLRDVAHLERELRALGVTA